MTDQLSLYNGALRICKERKLTSLSGNYESLRLLDAAWGDGATTGAVKHCLQLGQWTFATRSVQADASPSVEPPFGYRYAFDQPTDMVRPVGIFFDPQMQLPLLQYVDERHFWYCDYPTIYVRYVSNLPEYGADYANWPESFVKLVEAYLAREIVGNLTQGDAQRERVEKEFEATLKSALSLDAMNTPTRFPPVGQWEGARRGRYGYRASRWSGTFR